MEVKEEWRKWDRQVTDISTARRGEAMRIVEDFGDRLTRKGGRGGLVIANFQHYYHKQKVHSHMDEKPDSPDAKQSRAYLR